MSASLQQKPKPRTAAAMAAREIQLIHVGMSKLGLDAETKATIYKNFGGGKTSSKDMTWQERKRVLDHLVSVGFKPTTPAAAAPRGKSVPKPSRTLDTTPPASKARALWLALHTLGEVRDLSEAALQKYVARITKVDDIHWASDADMRTLIETLKKWVIRVCARLAPDLMRRADLSGLDGQTADDLKLAYTLTVAQRLSADAAQDLIALLRRAPQLDPSHVPADR